MGLGKATLSFTVLTAEDLPEGKFPRWAVLGRSNVGKSSLLNALIHPQKLFRTGSNPGVTTGLIGVKVMLGNHVKSTLEIVDVPGFGFAINPKRRDWENLGEALNAKSENTGLMWLWLVDVSREPDELDHNVSRWLGMRPYRLVYTKSDQIKKSQRPKHEKRWGQFVERATEHSIWASSLDGEGMEDLAKAARNFLRKTDAILLPKT
jgi:GTP-binding protein